MHVGDRVCHRVWMDVDGVVIEHGGEARRADCTMDAIFSSEDPVGTVETAFARGGSATVPVNPLAPIGSQEVWAAGVTYERSRTARRAESADAGGGTFYDHVYDADRPELFFKGTASRAAGPGAAIRMRGDSAWNVPEPELTLAVSAGGEVFGYTIGNDMSSRDIEGANPLYLPQAKVYRGSTGLGPCLTVTGEPLDPNTRIHLVITRDGDVAFSGDTPISRIRRPLPSLAAWLFREDTFPTGVYLMTGTGIVPPDDFTLATGDVVEIAIDGLGTLTNPVG